MTNPTAKLRGKERRYLRGLGNALRPTVYLGKEGPFCRRYPFAQRSLYQQRVGQGATASATVPSTVAKPASSLPPLLSHILVQILGNTLLLYRPDPDDPQIALPE